MINRIFISVCIFILFAFLCFSDSIQNDTKADQQFNFSKYLMTQKDYFRAITEIKRFTFTFPDDTRVKEADFMIADCYYKAGKWENALADFSLIATNATGRKSHLCILKKAHCLIELKSQEKAIKELSSLIAPSTNTTTDINTYALMLCTLATVKQKNIDKTTSYLNQLAKLKDDTAVIFSQSALSTISSYSSGSKKSPLLASTLSTIIPGTGQIYSGRTSDGLVAAGSIILMSAMAINANTSNHDGERNFLYVFNISQYISNIYGANKAARNYNDNKKNTTLNQLNDNIIGTLHNLAIYEEIPCD